MKANGVKRVDSRWDRIRDSIWLLQRSCASQPIKKLKIMKNLDILKGKNDRKNNMDILTSHHLLHLNYVYKYFKIIFYLLLKYSELESWVLIRLDLIKLRVITVVWGLNSWIYLRWMHISIYFGNWENANRLNPLLKPAFMSKNSGLKYFL